MALTLALALATTLAWPALAGLAWRNPGLALALA
jgi:hypothetical protein